jgi:hypothetical protein
VSRVRSFSSSASSETVASASRILAQLQWYTTDPCGGNQWQSVAIREALRGTQGHSVWHSVWHSVAISGTQWHSEALSGTQKHSEALRGTQRHSEALSGACAPASLAARGTLPAATQANTRGERGAERASRELRGCGMVHAMRMNSAPEAIKRLWNGACNEDDAMRMNSTPEAIKRGHRPPLRALTCGIAPT